MNLYVWHDALADYTGGVIFAMASSVEAARKKVLACAESDYQRNSFAREIQGEPAMYTGKEAAGYCYGGG